jgi:Protein of unknown function (DUF3313)
MKRTRTGRMLAWLAAVAVGACTTAGTPIDTKSTEDGLERVDIKGFDAVYRKPGVDVSKYDKLLLRPVEVAFRKDWNPGRDSLLYQMNPPDREKIKQSVAENFADVFGKELERGGYQVVTDPAPDVLEVRASIIDLFINAPDVSMQTAARVSTYSVDTGEMTLVAEIHDSITGELLARAYDKRSGNNTGWVQPSNSVWNTAEARRAMQAWAQALVARLDAAKGKKT